MSEQNITDSQGALWEVFVQSEAGAPHTHAGSVRAADAELALLAARDVYARRGSPSSLWVVPTEHIVATTPEDNAPFFEQGDKPYRHPKFYKTPRGIRFS